jgi:hypothetical protein
MFTGDRAGDLLYATLPELGSHPRRLRRGGTTGWS